MSSSSSVTHPPGSGLVRRRGYDIPTNALTAQMNQADPSGGGMGLCEKHENSSQNMNVKTSSATEMLILLEKLLTSQFPHL